MKSHMAAALACLALLSATLLSSATAPARAAETFAYRLLPGKSTLRYAILSDAGNREMFAGISGTFEFTLHDDGAITSTGFDLTIEGPFYDDMHALPDWAPFAPGDKLADYLAVDFANEVGFTFNLSLPNGPLGPTHALVGPANGNASAVVLGSNYYFVRPLDDDPSVFVFESDARAGLEGAFQVFPETEVIETISGGGGGLGGVLVIPRLEIAPNVVRVPEPAALVLALAAILALDPRRASRR